MYCLCSRQAGQRVGGYLESIVPLISHFINLDQDDNDLKGSDFDELKESCLQAFEALVVRCFREITPHIKEVSCMCLCVCVCVWGGGGVGILESEDHQDSPFLKRCSFSTYHHIVMFL